MTITTFIIITINFYLHEVFLTNINDYDNFNDFDKYYPRVHPRNPNLPPCNEDQLMMYLAEIQAINPESIINLSTLKDLNFLCNKVSDSLNKMDAYLRTCEPPQQKDLYVQLIKGVNALNEKLCSNGTFKKNFEKHYECFHDLHNDLEDCSGPADWTEDDSNAKVCKAYHDIADCYYTKTAQLCGKEAANLMKQLILAVINSVLIIHCDNVKTNPRVENVMPEAPNFKAPTEIPEKSSAITRNSIYIELNLISLLIYAYTLI